MTGFHFVAQVREVGTQIDMVSAAGRTTAAATGGAAAAIDAAAIGFVATAAGVVLLIHAGWRGDIFESDFETTLRQHRDQAGHVVFAPADELHDGMITVQEHFNIQDFQWQGEIVRGPAAIFEEFFRLGTGTLPH